MSSSDEKRPSVPPNEDEIREAEACKEAVDEGTDPVGELLVSSYRPHEIAEADHERILARALAAMPGPAHEASVDDEPPAAEPEKRDARLLKEALEAPAPRPGDPPAHRLAELARAVRNAHAPTSISEIRNEAILRPALKAPTAAQNRRYVTASIVGALALAAAVAGMWIRAPKQATPSADNRLPPVTAPERLEFEPGMAETRTTTDLFQREDFPASGGTSDRIDRISQSRNSDLRENRFIQWGVP